nr:hypothetical protein [Tanacetum cinerariifolium]
MTNKVDTFLKAINDRMTGAPPTVNKIETPKLKEPGQPFDDEFKDLHHNLAVLKFLAYVPMYNAFLDKYMESFELGMKGSAFIQGEMPKKIKDHGLFTLPCRLGDSKPFETLADLGFCVNLILLYLFKMLKIRLLEETNHVFKLANGTKSYPVGIVENVEIHIGRLKLLQDFYVIDMKKDPATPLLTKRGFLATASVMIECRKAKIAVGEGVTRSIFRVKEIDPSDKEIPYWTTLGKRESYTPRPSTDGIDRPPKEGDGAWHIRIELIDPDRENSKTPFNKFPPLGNYQQKRIQERSSTWTTFMIPRCSIPSEDPYEEVAQQLLEQAPHSPEYVPDPIKLEDHVPTHIPEHPEDLVPAEDEAPIEAYIPKVASAPTPPLPPPC